jgi:hypothetical protein
VIFVGTSRESAVEHAASCMEETHDLRGVQPTPRRGRRALEHRRCLRSARRRLERRELLRGRARRQQRLAQYRYSTHWTAEEVTAFTQLGIRDRVPLGVGAHNLIDIIHTHPAGLIEGTRTLFVALCAASGFVGTLVALVLT